MNSDAENIQNEIGIEELEKSNDSSLKSDNHAESIETPYVEELTNETKKKTRMALEQLEMMIMKQSSGGNGLDISKLSEKQRDKVIDLMHKNEDNAYGIFGLEYGIRQVKDNNLNNIEVLNNDSLKYESISRVIK